METFDEIESVDFSDFTDIKDSSRLLILNSTSKALSLYDYSKKEFSEPKSHSKLLQNTSNRGEIYKRTPLHIVGPCFEGKHLFLNPQTPAAFFISVGTELKSLWQDPTREKEKPVISCEIVPRKNRMVVFTDRYRLYFAKIEPFEIISSRRKFWTTKTSLMASMMNRDQSEEISFSPNGGLCFLMVGDMLYELILGWNMKIIRMINLRKSLKMKEEMNPCYAFQVIDSNRFAVCHQNKLALMSYSGKKITMIQVGDSINTVKPFIYFKQEQAEYVAVWGSRLEVRNLSEGGELVLQESPSQKWFEKISYLEGLNCLVILGRKNNARHQMVTYISFNRLVTKS